MCYVLYVMFHFVSYIVSCSFQLKMEQEMSGKVLISFKNRSLSVFIYAESVFHQAKRRDSVVSNIVCLLCTPLQSLTVTCQVHLIHIWCSFRPINKYYCIKSSVARY